MDFFIGIVIAVSIGYSIFKERPQEKAACEQAERAPKSTFFGHFFVKKSYIFIEHSKQVWYN